MESELKCPKCTKLYTYPVLLQCSHNLCFACAQAVQTRALKSDEDPSPASGSGSSNGTNSSSGTEVDPQELDKLSLISEADSGVVCNSRPNSYVGTPNIGTLPGFVNTLCWKITCPVCNRITNLDDQGAASLPKNRALENIVDKYGESKHYNIYCQMCEKNCNTATVMCEQCQVFYCDPCRETCHPDRGPLAEHKLVSPEEGKAALKAKNCGTEPKCADHVDENLSMYCVVCKCSVCYLCVQEGHVNHEVQALGAMCKSQKQQLSSLLHRLSERARSGTEFIQNLKSAADSLQENCVAFEASTVSQCDALIQALELKKQQLLEEVRRERDRKHGVLRDQVSHCTVQLQKTTALLQFSIEVLKEIDPASFLQVSGSIIERVKDTEQNFMEQMEFEARATAEFELHLDSQSATSAVNKMQFYQKKDGIIAPGIPRIIAEQCSAENNTVTIAWSPHPGSTVDGFVLELDDGNSGNFREVYCGKEMVCTVEGLHFDSLYHARVKAYNHAGDGPYSDCICLQTASVAWFSLDVHSAHPEMVISSENMMVTSNSYDDHIVLGNVGFSRGVHYWEWTIEHYAADCDPSFGVARYDVPKDQRIGKDGRGWAMYIDSKRSWFMHNSEHTDRTEGGIRKGSVVGVLLDLRQHILSFFVDGHPHGPIAFTGLQGIFYPAVSLNHNVTVTLHSGLEVPPIDSESDDD